MGTSRRGRIGSALLAVALGITALVATSASTEKPAEAATVLAPGFSSSTVFSGLTLPTAFQFAPDGRVFVAEKAGVVKVFDNVNDPTPTVFADLSGEVYNYIDRGLLSLTVDPQWPARPYIYVLYAYDHILGDPAAAPKYNDTCAGTGSGVDNGNCVASARLSRLTANVANNNDLDHMAPTNGEKVLVEDWCQQFPIHINGTVAFGTDGKLYASHGSAASAHFTDYGQTGIPANPCSDPPVPAGSAQTIPTAEGGALRSQDPQTPNDPYTLDGTVIRVDPDTGAGVPGNPLFSSSDANARRIVTYGLRMPFRIAPRPQANEMWIGDVGENLYEEVDRVAIGGPLVNGGWPCYEAGSVNPDYTPLNICKNLEAQGPSAVLQPYWQYTHLQPAFSGDTCANGGSSTSGLAFYGSGAYPTRYNGALFMADYARQCIYVMLPGANGLPDPTKVENFASGIRGTTDIKVGPGGDLWINDLISGTISHVVYSGANRPPIAQITADKTNGPAPLTVKFDATSSTDPDGDALHYSWDLNGDGQFGDSTSATPTSTYSTKSTTTVRLQAIDSKGAVGTTTVQITAGNTAPSLTITSPTSLTRFSVGDQVNFAATATDPDDGTLPASAFTWNLVIEHCPGSCHEHPSGTFDGVKSGSFVAPAHEFPSYLELTLTVTDSGGLQTSKTVSIFPNVSTVTINSNQPGVPIDARGVGTTPFTRQLITGDRLSLSATDQMIGPFPFEFDNWSDGGAAAHDILVNNDVTLTANYSLRLLSMPDRVVSEAGAPSTVNVPVLMNKTSHNTVTVHYTVGPFTAGSSDVGMTSGTVSIPPGATRANIPIQVKADTAVEGTEFFVVRLDSPTNALVERSQGTMELLDDDGPTRYTYISKFPPSAIGPMTAAANKLGIPIQELPHQGANLMRYLAAVNPTVSPITPPATGDYEYATVYTTLADRDSVVAAATKYGVNGTQLHNFGAQLLAFLALISP